LTAKCSKHRDGWQEGPIPAGILSAFLDKLIPANAYSDIQSRNDGSFTFLSHESFCEPLLKASGTDGIFLKMHASQEKLELLWLDRQVSLSDTLAAATDKSVFGLAEKGQQGILALRFRIPMVTLYDLPKPTTSNKIWTCSDGKYQECPVQLGLSASPNCSQVSDVSGIVYQDDDHAVFTAPSHGKFALVHFNVENQPRTIRFKALNAAARQAAAEDAQTRRQLFRPSTRAE
jgi:hypothetical protein